MRHKKIFTKAISVLLSMVMILTMIPSMAMTAKAEGEAQSSVKIYFKIPTGDAATDWAVNAWQTTDVTVTGDSEHAFRPSTWGDGPTYPTLLTEEGKDGWGYVTLTGTVTGMQFLNKDAKEYKVWNAKIANENVTEAYFVPGEEANTGTWYKDAGEKNEIEEPVDAVSSTDLTIHFKNEKEWQTVYGMFGATSDWLAIEGYDFCKTSAFGGIIKENSKNPGWYSFNIKKNDGKAVYGLFNKGAWNTDDQKDNQTGNYSIDIEAETMEVWLTYETGTTNLEVSKEAPADWVAGAEIEMPVDPATLSTVESPVIGDDGSVTFNYQISEATLAGSKLYLMGEVPGTGWNTGLEMTDEDGDGVYSVTVSDLKPGEYQYKFKYGTNTWVTDPANAKTASGNSLLVVPGFLISAENPAGVGSFDVKAEITKGIDTESIEWYVKNEKGEEVIGISVKEDDENPTKAVITTTREAKTGYFLVGANYTDSGNAKSADTKLYYTEKAVLYEYEYKAGSDRVGKSDIYTWYNSKAGNVGAKFREVNGKNTAYITLDDTTKSFGYIVRLKGEWGASPSEDREYGDRTIVVGYEDLYTKVKGGEGIEVPYMLPSAKTEYDNGILFKWRDDDRFYNNTMGELKDATVKVVLQKDGGNSVEKTMTYNEQDELFTYHFTSEEGLEEGTYRFHFLVDGAEIQDQYWDGSIEYKKPELDIKTTVSPETVSYNENPVVSFEIKEKGTEAEVELSSITADISVLGYNQEVAFSTDAKEGVLYIDRSVKAGTYEVPFTIVDAWGNQTEEMVSVNVTDKTTADTSWDESRIYFLLTDRFMNGDTSNDTACDKTKIEAYHGGDFKGLTSKLDYLKDLGIDTIWITPIVDNIDEIVDDDLHQQGYHGYWAKNFEKIDEHLGDTTDLDNLIDEAQKRGIKLMVDIVVNHAGYNTNDDSTFAGMLRTEEDVVEGDVILGELDHLPDFKTEVPGVRQKLIAWQTAWANHTTPAGNRIAYFRVDTVKHVDHETWQDLKTSLAKVNPAFKMIGEYFGASITNTGDYLGNGQMDALLDFDFKSIASSFVNGNIDAAEANLEARNAKLSNGFTMGQFLSSHDEDGFLYTLGNDTAKMKVAAALQMTAKGMPIIYYGEEINLTGPNDFGNQNNNRYDMQFDNLSKEQQDMLAHYKKLLAARAKYSNVFATGTRTKLTGSDEDGYVVFKRSAGDNVYVGLNTTGTAKKVTFTVSEENLVDLYSGKEAVVKNGKVTVTIPANSEGGTVILVKSGKAPTEEPKKPVQPSTTEATTEQPTTQSTEQKDVKATKITISGMSKTITAGKKITLTAKVSPSNATNKKVTWKTSNKKYATVSSKGVVSTKSKGAGKTVTITATAADGSGVKATYKIKIVKDKVKSIKVSPSKKTVKAGAKVKLKATVKTTGKTANKKLTWSSSNKKYATVSSKGVVTTKKAGKGKTVKITAKATDGSGKKATVKIKIKK